MRRGDHADLWLRVCRARGCDTHRAARGAGDRRRSGRSGSIPLPPGLALRPVGVRLATGVLGRPDLSLWRLRGSAALCLSGPVLRLPRLSAVGLWLWIPALLVSATPCPDKRSASGIKPSSEDPDDA